MCIVHLSAGPNGSPIASLGVQLAELRRSTGLSPQAAVNQLVHLSGCRAVVILVSARGVRHRTESTAIQMHVENDGSSSVRALNPRATIEAASTDLVYRRYADDAWVLPRRRLGPARSPNSKVSSSAISWLDSASELVRIAFATARSAKIRESVTE